MAEKLYRFYWDCGRQGHLEGVFATDEAFISKLIGKTVEFGEVLGKHSDIHGELKEKDFTVLTDDAEFIAKAKQYKLVPTGHNPLQFLSLADLKALGVF